MRAQRRLRNWRKACNLGVDEMSIRIMTWAWSVALPPTSKLVLMALADIADDRGVCWPSHPTLAAKCSLTDRTVRRILVLLQAHKLVVVESRFNATGSQTSSLTPAQRDALQDRLWVLTHDQAQQILDELSGRLAIAQVKNPLRYCAVLIKRMQRGKFFPELGLNVAGAREAEIARHALLARIENVAAIESSAQRRALPPRQREAIRRMRTKSFR